MPSAPSPRTAALGAASLACILLLAPARAQDASSPAAEQANGDEVTLRGIERTGMQRNEERREIGRAHV